jgi:hypothetical protein
LILQEDSLLFFSKCFSWTEVSRLYNFPSIYPTTLPPKSLQFSFYVLGNNFLSIQANFPFNTC